MRRCGSTVLKAKHKPDRFSPQEENPTVLRFSAANHAEEGE
jgi:hypothetical protein